MKVTIRAVPYLTSTLIAGITALVLFLSTTPTNTEAADPAITKPTEKVARILWESSCEDDEDEAGLLLTLAGILLPKVIDIGVSAVTDHLSKKSTEYRVSHIGKAAEIWGSVNVSTTASVEGDQDSSSSSIETTISLDRLCVMLISGSSGNWGDEIRGRKGKLTPEVDRQFYPYVVASQEKRPAVFFMAEIEFEQVGQKGLVFRVVPLKLALNSITSRGRSGKDLVGSFRFSIPSVVTQGGFTHDTVFPPVRNVLVGDRIEIANLTSDWIPFPTLTGKINEEYSIPASVQVTLLETDLGNGALIYSKVANSIKEKQPKINQAFVEAVTPDSEENEK